MPLRKKLILIISVIGSVALLLASAVFVVFDQFNARQELKLDLSTLAEITAFNSRVALDVEEAEYLRNNLAALEARPQLVSAAFYKNGQILTNFVRRSALATTFPSAPGQDGVQYRDGFLIVFHPVVGAEGQRLGTLYMQYALDELKARLRRFSLVVAVILLGVSAITVWLSSKFQKFISEPILELANTARVVSEKNDYSIRSVKQTQDEVGFLVDQFNEMLAKIEEREKELEEVNKELGQSEQKALSASQAKSQFLANMSHELRTPLNAIIGFSEILGDKTFGDLNDKQARYVNNILTSGRHLLQLINDILDLAKIEAGRLTLDRASFNVASALEDVQNIVRTLANKKLIDLVLDVGPDLPSLFGDQPKFKQVMYNLLSNAIKFTPESGRVTVTAALECNVQRSTLNAQRSTNCIRISVIDTGIGIKPEDHARVFLEFEQVDSSYARQQHGTGLGLSLTRKLVEMHGGRIWIESEGIEGQGSTFTFVIPLPIDESATSEAETDDTASVPAERELRNDGQSKRLLVLVVEDDPQSGELLEQHLLHAGYSVVHARDGEQAIQKARELQPYAITLDILLPKKSGWEVLTELKSFADTKDIPVVIVSITNDRQLGFSLGANDYLVKPVNKDVFIEAIRKAGKASGKEVQTVLAIDDDPMTIEFLTQMIEAAGCKALSALGGKSGLELAVQHRPDVVVLDLMMPEVSGFEVVRQLRARAETKDIPILIYTAKTLTEQDRQQLTHYVQAITVKSGQADLRAELERLVRKS